MSKIEAQLSAQELDYLFSTKAIRDRAQILFERTEAGETSFIYHSDQLQSTVEYVLSVIRQKYPDLNIPFHSRWGHFRSGGDDRVQALDQQLRGLDRLERARCKLDLVITSVLLDAGAGMGWKYVEPTSTKTFFRSEGLGLASLNFFRSGKMASDGKSLRADVDGLKNIQLEQLIDAFQVSPSNPLLGVPGRLTLLHNLSTAVSQKTFFVHGRPGNILDYLISQFGSEVPAGGILRAVIDGFGAIWPGRIIISGRNLGDVWRHSELNSEMQQDLIPFHKLSQWMTYSLIEPIQEAGIKVTHVAELTGLAEYRNGGLLIDSGLLTLRNPKDSEQRWTPDSDLIIEWRALTIYLLDILGDQVRKNLGQSAEEFPLAKVLEGGTWWAGRWLAEKKRADGSPPLQIQSDGTVF